MPPVVVGAALSAGAGWALGGTFTTLFVQNLALGLISQALAPKPSSAGLQTSDNTQSVKSPIASRKIVYGRSRVGGTIVYLESTGSDNKYLHMVLALAAHEVDGLEKVYFDDELVWEGSYQDDWSSYARINFHDGSQTTADSDLVSESEGGWTSSHVLNDTAYLYLRLKFDRDKFANGVPNISAVVRGKKVYDPRSATTAWSQNPALCIRDYLLDTKYGMGVSASEINSASWIASANLCEETVVTSSGSQDRYLLDGVVDTAQSRKSIIEAMLTSLGGSLIYSGGEFYLEGSSYRTPTVTLDEAVIIDSMQIQTKRSHRELFNGVKGVFSSLDDNYVLTDYPAIISDSYALEDGAPSYLDVDLPYTTDVLMAERIAKLSLLRSRKQITCTVRCNLSAIALRAGDTVMLSNTRMGWSSKVFEVTNLSFEAGSDGALSVALNLIETSSDVYDWTTDDEIDFVAGQPTNLASPFDVNSPSGLSVTSSTVINADGSSSTGLDISFTNNDAFSSQFEITYYYGSETPSTILTSNTYYRIESVEYNQSYTISVVAVNRLGARSSATTAVQTVGADVTAPSVPSTLSSSGGYRQIRLTWANPSDLDFDLIEVWRNTSDNSASASKIAETRSSSYVDANLGMNETFYYWVKAVDRTGNISAFSTATNATTTFINDTDFSQDVLDLFDEAGLYGVTPVDDLLTDGAFVGEVVFLTTDNKLYRWNGTAWISAVDGADIDDDTIVGDKIVANTITGGLLAASGIITNSAQIDDAVITNAKIENGAITTAKIGDLQVDTLKIADNAVTVPVSAYYAGPISYGTSWTTVGQITVDGHNVPHILMFSGYGYNINWPNTQIQIVEGGSVVYGPVLYSVYSSFERDINGALYQAGSTSSRTYYLQAKGQSYGSNTMNKLSIISLTVKK